MKFIIRPMNFVAVSANCSGDCSSNCIAKCNHLGSCFCPLKGI